MKRVLIMGPYYLHPILDIETIRSMLPKMKAAIVARGGEPFILTCGTNSGLLSELYKVFGDEKVLLVDSKGSNSYSRLKFICAGIQYVRKLSIEVVTNLAGAISYGFDALMVATLTGIKSVPRVSGNEILTRKFSGRYDSLTGDLLMLTDILRERAVFRFSDALIVMSRLEADRVLKIRRARDRIFVAPFGVDLRRFDDVNYSLFSAPLKVLYVGRKSLEKGWDIFLKVAKHFVRSDNYRFTAVGDFNPGVNENVQFLGYVDPKDMPRIYSEHHVLLLPSRTEGFPRVLAEGMASGLVPLVPKHLFQDVLTNGENAKIVELDVHEFIRELTNLASSEVDIEDLRLQARKFAKDNLDSDLCLSIYTDALLS